MDITQLLNRDCTLCAVSITSKKKLIEQLSQIAATQLVDIEEQDILNAFLTRERLGSTGIGNGIALPHGKLTNISQTLAILITTQDAIDFDAIDNRPVNVFFALLVPENESALHLKSLAMVAEKLSNKDTLKKIKHATNQQALYAAITQ